MPIQEIITPSKNLTAAKSNFFKNRRLMKSLDEKMSYERLNNPLKQDNEYMRISNDL